ncbi:hypothetical protein HK101_006897 [Irineochytrium annulatum]|nr:hypothetical protein HK101_006897 [Irineochytrium annulatum]
MSLHFHHHLHGRDGRERERDAVAHTDALQGPGTVPSPSGSPYGWETATPSPTSPSVFHPLIQNAHTYPHHRPYRPGTPTIPPALLLFSHDHHRTPIGELLSRGELTYHSDDLSSGSQLPPPTLQPLVALLISPHPHDEHHSPRSPAFNSTPTPEPYPALNNHHHHYPPHLFLDSPDDAAHQATVSAQGHASHMETGYGTDRSSHGLGAGGAGWPAYGGADDDDAYYNNQNTVNSTSTFQHSQIGIPGTTRRLMGAASVRKDGPGGAGVDGVRMRGRKGARGGKGDGGGAGARRGKTWFGGRSAQTTKLGVLKGVYIPTFQNIVGIIVFVRFGWIVGHAGIGQTLIIAALATSLTFLTALSMCAIVTNGRVPGGGAYYMISRSLGKEFGGSVGILFYLGNAIGSAMYVLGVVEVFIANVAPQISFGDSSKDARIYGTVLLLAVALVVLTGVRVFQSISIFFFTAVVLALLSTLAGMVSAGRPGAMDGVAYFPRYFTDNWNPGYQLPNSDGYVGSVTFFDLVGVFFPAVTGVLAGSSRVGELEDPQRDIPRGTLAAHLSTSLMYFIFILLLGGSVTGPILRTETIMITSVLSFPIPWITIAGCLLASVGAALQCLLSAPRLLQAMAKDQIAPFLLPFRHLSKRKKAGKWLPANEPRRALILSVIIAEAALLVGSLNGVSRIVTLLYLTCYAFVNMSTAVLGFLKTPNWRPGWKYYHWSLSLLGAVMAFAMAFMISWYVTLGALFAMILLFKYIEYKGAQVQWGDGLQAMHLEVAQRNLWSLERDGAREHVKNWRPHIMLFVKVKEKEVDGQEVQGDDRGLEIKDPGILDFLSNLKKGKIFKMMAVRNFPFFRQVVISPTLGHGIVTSLQCTGLGRLRPNTVMLGWPTDPTPDFVDLLRTIISLDKALLLVKGMSSAPPPAARSPRETVDVFWLVHDGGILTLLAHVLLKHARWRHAQLRIFAIATEWDNSVAMRRNLEATLDQLRIPAICEVLEMGDGGGEGWVMDVGPFAYEQTTRAREREALLREVMRGGRGNALALPSAGSALSMDVVSGMGGGVNVGESAVQSIGEGMGGTSGAGSSAGSSPKAKAPEAKRFPPRSGSSLLSRMLNGALGGGSSAPVMGPVMSSTLKPVPEALQRRERDLESGGCMDQPGSRTVVSAGEEEAGDTFPSTYVDGGGSSSASINESVVFEMPPVRQRTNSDRPTDLWTVHGIPRSRQLSSSDAVPAVTAPACHPTAPADDNRPGSSATLGDQVTPRVTFSERPPSIPEAGDAPARDAAPISQHPPNQSVADPRLNRLNAALRLNQLIRSRSSVGNCRLVLCNLPSPGAKVSNAAGGVDKGFDSAEYLEYLQAIQEGIPRMVLVKGTGLEVVTTFF